MVPKENAFSLESKDNASQLIVFKIRPYTNAEIRHMVVIEGIPFYFSSGEKSNFPNTLFVFRGISPYGWIKKCWVPKQSNFFKFCELNHINIDHVKHRLGSLRTTCISASIGGGFWDTLNGQLAKAYLEKNYQHYFLSEAFRIQILKAKKGAQTLLVGDKQINEKLIALGTILPLDDHHNRIPDRREQTLFKKSPDERVQKALKMMFNQEQKINKPFLTAVQQLSSDKTLMDYALSVFLFEDAKQSIQFKKMVDKKTKITLADLQRINKLHNCVLPVEYRFLLENNTGRRCLRLITESSNSSIIFKSVELEIIAFLHRKNILESYMAFFKRHCTREILQLLFKNDLLVKKNLALVQKHKCHLTLLNQLMTCKKITQQKLDQLYSTTLRKSDLMANTMFAQPSMSPSVSTFKLNKVLSIG